DIPWLCLRNRRPPRRRSTAQIVRPPSYEIPEVSCRLLHNSCPAYRIKKMNELNIPADRDCSRFGQAVACGSPGNKPVIRSREMKPRLVPERLEAWLH